MLRTLRLEYKMVGCLPCRDTVLTLPAEYVLFIRYSPITETSCEGNTGVVQRKGGLGHTLGFIVIPNY